MNKTIGIEASAEIEIANRINPCLKIKKKARTKATIIVIIATKRNKSPQINFLGNDLRKSSMENREVRMDKKERIEEVEEAKDTASAMAKILNKVSRTKIGIPVPCPLPPGTVKAAAKTTVAIRVATSMHEFAVFIIHFSAFFRRSS